MYETTTIGCYVYDIAHLVQFSYVVLVESTQTETICDMLVFTLL